MSDSEVLSKDGKLTKEVVNICQLRWLGHILYMTGHQPPRYAMFAGIGLSYKKVRADQTKTWLKSIMLLMSELIYVVKCRLPG